MYLLTNFKLKIHFYYIDPFWPIGSISAEHSAQWRSWCQSKSESILCLTSWIRYRFFNITIWCRAHIIYLDYITDNINRIKTYLIMNFHVFAWSAWSMLEIAEQISSKVWTAVEQRTKSKCKVSSAYNIANRSIQWRSFNTTKTTISLCSQQ